MKQGGQERTDSLARCSWWEPWMGTGPGTEPRVRIQKTVLVIMAGCKTSELGRNLSSQCLRVLILFKDHLGTMIYFRKTKNYWKCI